MFTVSDNMEYTTVKHQWVYDSLTDPVLDGAPQTRPVNCKKEHCLLKFSDVFKRQIRIDLFDSILFHAVVIG